MTNLACYWKTETGQDRYHLIRKAAYKQARQDFTRRTADTALEVQNANSRNLTELLDRLKSWHKNLQIEKNNLKDFTNCLNNVERSGGVV